MTFSEAKKEFEIRLYLWATSEFEREINESLPSFNSFKAGTVWETRQFIQQLNVDRQRTLARGLLKRFHPNAVKHLGETCSAEEAALRSKRDDFFRVRDLYKSVQHLESNGMPTEARGILQTIWPDLLEIFGEAYFNDERSLRSRIDATFATIPASFEQELAARKEAGEKFKFVSKRKLRNALTARFKETFGSQCFAMESVDEEDEPSFQMKHEGWIVTTHFWFGRRETLLNYSHMISSEETFEQQGAEATYVSNLVLASLISVCSWLGICSQTNWEYLTDVDVGQACEAAIDNCKRFFALAPKILKGLDAAEITVK